MPELTPAKLRIRLFEKPTFELVGSTDLKEQAMLQWRLVTPLGIIVLGLLGLKMSKTGPREGRFVKIFFALVLYILYNQLLVVGRGGISETTADIKIIFKNNINILNIPNLFNSYSLKINHFLLKYPENDLKIFFIKLVFLNYTYIKLSLLFAI